MSQVVEILDTLQAEEEDQEDATSQSGGHGVILYEALKKTPTSSVENTNPTKNDGVRGVEEGQQSIQKRSKSEPPTDLDPCIQSPEFRSDERSASTRM